MTTNFLSKKRKDESFNEKDEISSFNFFSPPTNYDKAFNNKSISFNSKIEELFWNPKYTKTRKSDKELKINIPIKRYNPKRKSFIKLSKNNKNYNFNKKYEYIYHCLNMKGYTINDIIEINKLKKIPQKKFNLILDIDLTMIKAVELNDKTIQRKSTDIEIKGKVNSKPYHYYYRYRPYLINFVKELKNYFNFYISTLSHENYAKQIIDNFMKKTGVIIPRECMISRNENNMKTKVSKFIKEFIRLKNKDEINNTIIIDDSVSCWFKEENVDENNIDTIQCIKSLIPSKRYIMNCSEIVDNYKYDVLIHNNIFEKGFDKNEIYKFEVEHDFCIEKDYLVNKNWQLFYLENFIKKCIRFSLFSGVPLVEAMHFFRKKIFENCKFNLKYLDNRWISPMNSIIKELGGVVVISIEEATHFIMEKKISSKKKISINKNQKYVNLSYIFQCYFNMHKFDESESKFNAISENLSQNGRKA